jgi:hypothetical protein
MNKHTPGPWRWWETVHGARVAGHPVDGSKNFVCDVLIPERNVSYKDNARLIAAAPELLMALQSFERTMWWSRHSFEVLEKDSTMRQMFRAAIAKATGVTNAD